MRELTFVGLADDRIVLAASDGQEYAVAIDERLATAVRRDRARLAQLDVAEDALRPKDIQSRIRAGATAEEVANEAGIPVERVRRYEGPVLQERSWIAQRAQTVELRRPGSPVTLGEVVARKLTELGVDEPEWDAARREDGKWLVRLTYAQRGGAGAAAWLYDHADRTVAPLDETARSFTDSVEEERPRLVALPSKPGPVEPIAAEPEPEPTERPAVLFDPAPVEAPAGKTRRRRASVPSWDEILFGSRSTEE